MAANLGKVSDGCRINTCRYLLKATNSFRRADKEQKPNNDTQATSELGGKIKIRTSYSFASAAKKIAIKKRTHNPSSLIPKKTQEC
eukprot:scaffold89578_cov55-Attheya_sp.AAC.8